MLSKTFASRFLPTTYVHFLSGLLAIFVGLNLSGCNSLPKSEKDGRLVVCCTTGQVADLVRAIGGDQVQVQTLIGPGVDPHSYRQSRGDAATLDQAEVIFYSGLHLEGRLSDLLHDLEQKKPTLGLGEAILKQAPDRIRRPDQQSGQPDPHLWFDAELWSLSIPAVVEKLSSLRPEQRSNFQTAGERYRAQLLELHAEAKQQIGLIPAQSRVLVTAHDAFGYFGQAYGIEVHGLQGISTVDEASLAGINALVELLVTRQIKAVFVESSVPKERLQQVLNGCQNRGHQIVVGGELYSDALGDTGSTAETYAGMFRYNLRTIVDALK